MTQILHFLPSVGADRTAVSALIYVKMPKDFTFSAFFKFLLFFLYKYLFCIASHIGIYLRHRCMVRFEVGKVF